MIADLLQIVQETRIPFRDDCNTMDTIQASCHNWAITGFDCDLGPTGGLYAEVVWEPINYLDEIDQEENLVGEVTTFYHKKKGRLSFRGVVNPDLLNTLNIIAASHSAQIRNLSTNDIFNIQEVAVQANNQIDAIGVEVAFSVVGMDEVLTSCCASLFDGSYEECDPVTGTPPPQPAECNDFVVTLTPDIPGGTISAASIGGPGGAQVFTWWLDPGTGVFGLLPGSGSSITLTDVGTYRVQVQQGGCTGVDEFLYDSPCASYMIGLTQVGDLIVAEPNFEVPALGYEWYEIQAGPIEVGPDPGQQTNVYTPPNSGTFRVKVNHAVCGVIQQDIVVALSTDCAGLDFDLTRVDNVLQVDNISGCTGNVTYSWFIDRGDGSGSVLIPSALGPSINLTEIGLYTAQVDCDNPVCSHQESFFVLDNCVQFKAWIGGIAPAPGGVTFQALSQNAPTGTNVLFVWFEWVDENWVQIGTGSTLFIADTEDPANIKLEATAGNCMREDYSHDCVDPSTIEPYQAHYAVGMETETTITAFTFQQPIDQGGTFTENQIGARYLIEKNGLVQKWKPLADMATTNEQNVYSYDFADNKIVWPTNNPLFSGDRISALDRLIP